MRLARRYLVVAAVWAGLALAAGAQAVVRATLQGGGTSFPRAVTDQLPLLLMWALATPAILWSARRFRCGPGTWKRHGLIHLAAGSLFVFLLNAANALVIELTASAADPTLVAWWQRTLTNVVTWYHLALLVYLAIVAIGHLGTPVPARAWGGVGAAAPAENARREDDSGRVAADSRSLVGAGLLSDPSAASQLSRGPNGRQYLRRIAIKADRTVRLVAVDEIDWIEADGDYVVLHAGRQCYRYRERLRQLERLLAPQHFARVHRSAIVNVTRIREIQPYFHGDAVIILRDGTRLRLSRRRRQALAGVLGQQL